ncbi:hypothetical protein EYZ11_004891 [Aspergillus tanneri]|uniref:Uncharacterized protein n=1 Tax=Aspergillus tanneri TaxID=1220188 RepID=A0A4S3JJA2_9EURO|nr:hypothetical protein EYZ11_004891 [Aspergillus tanneri]
MERLSIKVRDLNLNADGSLSCKLTFVLDLQYFGFVKL